MLAFIPARGGSKGIPNKNLAMIGGKPLIAWTIQTALEAEHITRIIVSTDSKEIAAVATSLGAEVPFLRPSYLSGDHAHIIDAAIYTLQAMNINNGLIVVLQPTSVFRSTKDIENACEVLQSEHADSLVSLTESTHPIVLRTISNNGTVEQYLPGETEIERQALRSMYALNGAIYISYIYQLLTKQTWYVGKTVPYIMPKERSIDIDSPYDLLIANLWADYITNEIIEG